MSWITTVVSTMALIGLITLVTFIVSIFKTLLIYTISGKGTDKPENYETIGKYLSAYGPHLMFYFILNVVQTTGLILTINIYIIILLFIVGIALIPALRSTESKFNGNSYVKFIDSLLRVDGKLPFYSFVTIINFYLFIAFDCVALFL
jgi:hypothetical protein